MDHTSSKILVLSHHFHPEKVVGIYRTLGYSEYLPEYGFGVDVMTFHYQMDDRGFFKIYPDDADAYYQTSWKGSTVYRVVRKPSKTKKVLDLADRILGIRQAKNLLLLTFGHFLKANHSWDSYRSFKRALWKVLENEKYSLIICINYPEYHLRLGYEARRKFGVHFVPDFKDLLWDNRLAKSGNRKKLNLRVIDGISGLWVKKWLREALFITTSSVRWSQVIQKYTDQPLEVVSNGFDQIESSGDWAFEHFTIGYAGSLNSDQLVKPFLKGLGEWLMRSKRQVRLLFLRTPQTSLLKETLDTYGLSDFVAFLPATEKSEAVGFVQSCHLLWYPAARTMPGWIPDKVYDFIFS